MDQFCCLLGLCCPPLRRVESVTEWIMGWGVDKKNADIVASKLIAAVDASELGQFMRAVVKHVKHDA